MQMRPSCGSWWASTANLSISPFTSGAARKLTKRQMRRLMVGTACPRNLVQLGLRVSVAEQVCQEVGERRDSNSLPLTERC